MHRPLSLVGLPRFHSFLTPGMILFTANGVLSLVIFVAGLRRAKGYGNLVVLQGFVIAGWITVEVILMQAVVWPHFVYWAVGLVLIVCGLILRRDRRAARPVLVATH